MTDDKDAPTKEELNIYEKMVTDRLELLKKSLDESYDDDATEDDKSTGLVSFVMLHIASNYARLDIALGEIERLTEAYNELKSHLNDEMEAMKIADAQDEYLTAKSDFEKELAKEQETPL